MNLPDALIGHTGFVGSHLGRDWGFRHKFNSKNIGDIRHKSFGVVVCAGVSAVKWLANKEPEKDWVQIEGLVGHLDTISCEHFVLVSTVDVYSNPIGVTEDDIPDPAAAQPYGKHRRLLEQWVERRFPSHTIIRLPGLFGQGLKKNIIFDMMTGNMCSNISPNGVFQWYPLHRFASDLRKAIAASISPLNIAVEPISTAAIQAALFPEVAIGGADLPHARYDMQTRHAGLLGGTEPYHLDAPAVMAELASFVQAMRK